MYVRWKRNRKSRSAVLVKSERVDGQPRLRHVAYLGSLPDDVLRWLQQPPAVVPEWVWNSREPGYQESRRWRKYTDRRNAFWASVGRTLRSVAGLSDAERDTLVAKLEAVVPRSIPAERQAMDERRAARCPSPA